MVGIDIGTKSIKVIELARSGEAWVLKASGAVGFVGISPDKATDEKELQAISDVLAKMVKQIGISSKEVNLSLPESSVFTRVIKFPLLSDEEVSAAVKWEAEQYVPIPINEAVVEYMILEKNDKTNSTSVLLMAAPKAVVEKYVKVMRLADLTPVFAETELTATARALASNDGIFLILDLGSSATDMSIVKNGMLVFTRSIPVAGDAFTRAVAQGLNINLGQAEGYKKTYGLSSTQLEGKVKAALDPVFSLVVDEVKKAIHFYQTEEKGELPSSILITGGASTMPDIVPYLTEKLGIETIFGNPFAKVSLDPETVKAMAPYLSLYSTAVGLAMREE